MAKVPGQSKFQQVRELFSGVEKAKFFPSMICFESFA